MYDSKSLYGFQMERSATKKTEALYTPPGLLGDRQKLKRVLKRTRGLWRGRRLNALAYQRRLRSEYGARLPRV